MDNIEYYVLTTCVFVLVFTIAYFVEDLGHLVSFMGTSTCFILWFPFPSLFYLILSQRLPNKFYKVCAYFILAISIVFFTLIMKETVGY